MAQASNAAALKKHPSVHDTSVQQERYQTSDFELDDDEYEDDDQMTLGIGVVSDSAAAYASFQTGPSLDKVLFF